MRRKLTAFGLVAVIAASGMSFSVLGTDATQAAGSSTATFIIPANSGYGVGDCASAGSTCKVVADSWCEAQGFARSESFGFADPADVTGALSAGKADRPISITCAE